MEIKDIQGNILIDTLVTQDAVKVDELMKQHNITLSWIAVNNEQLPLGAYIDYDGVRYSLLEPYSPEQVDEATYSYKPIFHHPVMRWQHLPFFFYSGGTKETDWSLTDNPANFMDAVCEAIFRETGDHWTYSIVSNIDASASLSFSKTDIFSALNSIASAFGTEWWFDYANRELHLSKAYNGSAVTLEVGKNIGVPSKTGSKEGYFTRFYAFGSTRNIEQNYAGSNVNSIVNKRLTLDPQKYPDGYIDIREGLTSSEVLVKTLVYDDIYPRSSLSISDVKVRLMWRLDDDNKKVQIGTDAEGNPVYDQYAIWYFKIPGLEFNKDSIISGKPLSVHFNSGSLNGREFELTYHSEEKTVETSDGIDFVVEPGDYEINFIEEGTYIIPSITGLIPVEGDEITLFNIVMPEEYKASAYIELERAVRSKMANQNSDTSNYSFNSNKVAFYESNPNLSVGRSVVFKNGSQVLYTRVIKLETQLDYPFEQKITVGNEQIKGTTQTLKEEVVSANENIDLISAINKSTEAFTQSLQKTQKAVQNSLAKWAEMWNYDKEHDAARTKLNLIVEKSITFGGAKESEGEEGGGSAGITTFDVFVGNNGPYPLQDGKVNLPAYPVVPTKLPNPHTLTINGTPYDGSAPVDIKIKAGVDDTQLADYAKKEWVEQQGYLTELLAQHTYQPLGDYALLDDLKSYLTKSSAEDTYATIVALNAAIADHDVLREDFDALNTLINANASEYIDTWNEVKTFLDGYSDSDDLATILAGINADIAKRAKQTDLDTAVANLTALSKEFSEFKELINSLWYLDPDHADTVRTKLNVVVEQAISFGGYGESDGTGGVGGLTSFKVKVGSTTYTSVGDTVSIPAYPVIPTKISAFTNDVNYAVKTDIPSLEGYAKLSDIPSLNDYLTTNTAQTILASGAKVFKGKNGENIYIGGTKSGVTLDVNAATGGWSRGFAIQNTQQNEGSDWSTFGATGGSAGLEYAYITIGQQAYTDATLKVYPDRVLIGGEEAIHTGNISKQKAGDADKLGGQLPSYYAKSAELLNHINTFNNYKKATDDRLNALESMWFLDEKHADTIRTIYNVVVDKAISFGGYGESTGNGGGITQVTKQMILDALEYTPYDAANPKGYITASALSGYAKLVDIPSLENYVTKGTTLAHYGIDNAYTKSASDNRFFGLNLDRIDTTVLSLNQAGYGYEAEGWKGSGPAIALGSSNGYTMYLQQAAGTYGLYVNYRSNGGSLQPEWKKIAFVTDNVASATKASDADKLGGQLPAYYATTSALENLQDSHNALSIKINTFLDSENLNGTIDRWKEVESFLLGYTDQQTLAELLNAKVDEKDIADLDEIRIKVAKLTSWFGEDESTGAIFVQKKDGVARDFYTYGAISFGGYGESDGSGNGGLTSFKVSLNGIEYTSVGNLVTITEQLATKSNLDTLSGRINAIESAINKIQNLWTIDNEHPNTIKTTYNIVVDEAISFGGYGESSGSGSSGGLNSFNVVVNGINYSSNGNTVTITPELATKDWVLGKKYLTSASLSNVVTLDGTQTITGVKTFSNGLKVGSSALSYVDGYLHISGDVVIEGAVSFGGYGESDESVGVTALAALTDVALSSPANGQSLVYENGKWVNKVAGLTSVDWSIIKNKPKYALGDAEGGNAIAAKRLTDGAEYKAWGQIFFKDGVPQTMSGSLSGVTSINAASGNVLIGADDSDYSEKFQVHSSGFAVLRVHRIGNSESYGSAIAFSTDYANLGVMGWNQPNEFKIQDAASNKLFYGGINGIFVNAPFNVLENTTFSKDVIIGTIPLSQKTQNSKKYLEIDGDLVVTGAISFGGYGESDGTGGAGGLTSFKVQVGTTVYSSVGDTVSIPAYPTKSSLGLGNVTNLAASGYLTDLRSNSTNAVSITVGGTTKNISSSTLKTSLGLGSLAYKSSLVASDIPDLSWSKITSGKPTTLSGYGITNAVTTDSEQTIPKAAAKTFAGNYGELIKVGGSVTGVLINVNSAAGGWSRAYAITNSQQNEGVGIVNFGAAGGDTGIDYAYITVGAQSYTAATLKIYGDKATIVGNTVLHIGNIGTEQFNIIGKAGSADKLVNSLTFASGAFVVGSFDGSDAKTINIPTTTSHISEGTNLYFTNARAVSALTNTLANYVTLANAQTITGVKTFSNGLKIGDISVAKKTQDNTSYIEIAGNLVVTGAISFGGYGESDNNGSINGSVVSYTPSVTSGTKLGAIVINGTSNNIYAPSIPSALPASDVYAWAKKSSLAVTDVPVLSWAKISDVSISSPSTGQVLMYNGSKWTNQTIEVGSPTPTAYALTINNSAGTQQVKYEPLTAAASLTLTKSMVGLGNVENTKLSTWAGSSNITTVGTITSGTWNGSSISNSYLANSSMTIAGKSVSLGGSLTTSTLKSQLGLGALAYKGSLSQSDIPSLSGLYLSLSAGGTVSGTVDFSSNVFLNGNYIYQNGYAILGKGTLSSPATATSIRSNGTLKHNGHIILDANNYSDYTGGSDERYKVRLFDTTIDLQTIANAPLFNFKWTNRDDDKIHLGTTAQYWNRTAFRYAVNPRIGRMWTMEYGHIALGNTIAIARELLPIKRKVSEIDNLKARLVTAEKRINELENELKQYRRN